MIAVLIEHHAGRWPLWLSPRQCIVLPVADRFNAYAQSVAHTLQNGAEMCAGSANADEAHEINVVVNAHSETLNKRIRQARLEQYNYIVVVGEREQDSGTIAVRHFDKSEQSGSDARTMQVEELRREMLHEIRAHNTQ